MEKKPSFFSGITLVDVLLAIAFTAIVAVLVQMLFPPMGWLVGILAALGLLYIARRRRDNMLHPPDEN